MSDAGSGRGLFTRINGLASLVVVQLFATIAFLVDFLIDLAEGVPRNHLLVEALVLLALVIGLLFGVRRCRAFIAEARARDSAVAVASGALADVVAQRFEEWHLTSAEAEVALLALKGFDTTEIAGFRKAAPGTVRAQLARIYAKAGVPSRAALVAYFFEELLDGPINNARPAAAPPMAE